MPAALYPRNKKKILATRTQALPNPEQVVAPLLCGECEQRFNRNGEDEVLRWIAPKAKKGTSPLAAALRMATPVFSEPDKACYWASTLGLSPEKFAYFGLSLVWRASAYDWLLPDGNRTTRLSLGEYAEPVRRYLAEEGPFPEHVHSMITVCTDERSQDYWMAPSQSEELKPMVMMTILGVVFRFWFGRVLPVPIDGTIFYPDPANPIFAAHCWDVLSVTLSDLVEAI
jgi:hypothetical protein